MFDVKIPKTYLITAFFIIEVIAVYFWNQAFKEEMQSYYDRKSYEVFSTYSVSQNTFRLLAESYFDQILNIPQTLDIMHQVQNADEVVKAEKREELYKLLLPIFNNLKYRGFKRLNFYLPNNESFLQFHKPDEFGAKAGEKAAGIKEANKHKQFVMGFQESRYFNGFRYIFPIFDTERRYVGCVEAGVGFNTIREEMMKIKKINYAFAIKKKAVGAAVYHDMNTNYVQSDVNMKYLYETSIFNTARRLFADRIDFQIRKKINEVLQIVGYQEISSGRKYTKSIPYKGIYYTAALVPVMNISNNNIGYLIGYSRDTKYKLLESQFHLRVAGTTLALLLIIGFVYFENRNIRHIRIQNREMKEKTWELRKSNNTKEKFLNFVAQDLNNPFHFIKGYSTALQDQLDQMPKEQQQEYLTIINQAAENGHHLIENLLEWSRIQKNDAPFEPEYHFLSDIIDDTMESYYSMAKAKKLSLYSKITRKEANKIYADRANIISIFRNLITNAIKYTQEGGLIKIYSQNIDNFLEVIVEDNGVGIRQETLRKLFATGKEQHEDDKTYAKLGLILTKELVERNGGELKVESQTGKGSKFIFTVPVSQTFKLFSAKS